jgi:excisionase family DNA binding protein
MLTAATVATMLGLSEKEVYSLAKAGKITHYRISTRSIRFDQADVVAYKKAATPPPRPLPTIRGLREYERLRLRAVAHGDGDGLPLLTPNQLELIGKRYRNMRRPPWANGEAIRAVYERAKSITRETGVPHHVDHIIPLQGEYVSGLHVEANLQVVPAVDNIRKRNKFDAADC